MKSLARLAFLLVAGSLALSGAQAAAQEAVTVSTLVQNPDRHDGQLVRVSGVVADYRERVARSGEAYTVFRLREGRLSILVFAWPHQGLRNGLRVRVTGTFWKIKTFIFINAQGVSVAARDGIDGVPLPNAALVPRLPRFGKDDRAAGRRPFPNAHGEEQPDA